MPDQLRARSLPLYQRRLPDADNTYPLPIETPHLELLASQSLVLDDVVSTCPVCTPYRAMLQTGRHPQTTGHIINSTRTRWSEIGLADAFGRSGYRTGYVGKWHLHTGAWPANNVPDWVPEGRDRLGWQSWRGYNQHMVYFDGYVNGDDWNADRWSGYETRGLQAYTRAFLDEHQASHADDPFFLFLSPQPPHDSPFTMAPEEAYAGLPEIEAVSLPANVPEGVDRTRVKKAYRDYMAMILMVDEMVGSVLSDLERRGLTDDTLVVFTSDHGTMGGSHGRGFWEKKQPQEESIQVPFMVRFPDGRHGGERRSVLTSPVDLFPSLCGLCGVGVPRTVEGHDLSGAWCGASDALQQEGVLLMNFSEAFDHYRNGNEWRGVRTRDHCYARYLDGREVLYGLRDDPLQMENLAEYRRHADLKSSLAAMMGSLMAERGDELQPCVNYRDWVDTQRRVVRNAYGPLPDPEQLPDWSLCGA
ncbi:Arylsulfatase [Mucisphaera calidilacus]|uniref:Arylsulfatase n=2 Tax=Mucisphaera calidilacus TaxID=2527982 RepID=A0A518BX11_9BACT|nr:Arylsulfatase [Mucisphaera calidilacus]